MQQQTGKIVWVALTQSSGLKELRYEQNTEVQLSFTLSCAFSAF